MGTAVHWRVSRLPVRLVSSARSLGDGIRSRIQRVVPTASVEGFGESSVFRVYANRHETESNSDSVANGAGRPTGEVTTSRELPDGVSLRVERASDIDVRPAPGFLELSPDDYAVMMTDGDDVVGWVFVRVERPVVVDRPGVTVTFDGPYLWGLFVEPAHRGRGFGSTLLSAATAFASQGEAPPVFAIVNAANERSIAVFDGLEFSVIDEIRVSRLRALGDRLGGRAATRRYGSAAS